MSKRARSERRQLAHAEKKKADSAERASRALVGATPERPVPIQSAAQVEVLALEHRCFRCAAPMQLLSHEASTHHRGLRIALLRCRGCGAQRSWYFQLPLLS